jgi:hypothetical protein
VQAWANHPEAPSDGSWSLSTGTFEVVFFLPKGSFYSPVHGIRHGYDKTGFYIGDDCKGDNGRYLIHDDLDSTGKPYNGAFSQGCVILKDKYHKALNEFLRGYSVKPGDTADMGVVEV